MDDLQFCIEEYSRLLGQGHIQKAYRGILSYMAVLKTRLEKAYPEFSVGGLYPGYMDMTYFSFTPDFLKSRKLKIAIVFLHERNRFEVWLGGTNRNVQAKYLGSAEQT